MSYKFPETINNKIKPRTLPSRTDHTRLSYENRKENQVKEEKR